MMRPLAVGILITALLAAPAGAQQIGVYGVAGHGWDTGTEIHRGFGASFAAFVRKPETATRVGLRMSFDLLPMHDPPVVCDPPECLEGGPSDDQLFVTSYGLVLLPYLARGSRLELIGGAAYERGEVARGKALMLGAGFSREFGNSGTWLNVSLQQRLNRTRGREMDQFRPPTPHMLFRRSLRIGIQVE